MFLHYIWDFDGTLFDSYPQSARAFQQALSDLGYSHANDEILSHLKISVTACINYYQEKYSLGEELRRKYKYYEHNVEFIPIKPYPYVKEVLTKITALGGKNYIYTHRDHVAIDYIRKYRLDDFFTDYITSEDGFASKPAPDAILHLIKKHNMVKDTAIMVGDRDIDILSGYNAGVLGCLFDPDNFFPEFEVDFRVKSMREFKKVVIK